MTVRYHACKAGLAPTYVCQRDGIEHGERICQSVRGAELDAAIGTLLLEMMTPVTLEVALAVQQELQQRLDEADGLRRQQVERARYEADLARQRFLQVDPNNRFVADALEADWNDKLRAVTEAQENCEQQRQADRVVLDDVSRAQILALVSEFPKLWQDPRTSDRERKRIVRLLVEDVTLTKSAHIMAQVRFKGGATHTLTLPLAPPAWRTWLTSPQVLAEIDTLLDAHTEGEIADILNARGRRTGKHRPFTRYLVAGIRRRHHLKSRFDRLRARGMLTGAELADSLGICPSTVPDWRRAGLVKGYAYNDKHEFLYEPPGPNRPLKLQGIKRSDPRRIPDIALDATKEVQDEA
jgi:hypothetical protein